RAAGRSHTGSGEARAKITGALLYSLTASQEMAIDEILVDMPAPTRMLRLLQGDVGSGKTVVALLALATVVEAGAQGASTAPTAIMAWPHMAALQIYCEAA